MGESKDASKTADVHVKINFNVQDLGGMHAIECVEWPTLTLPVLSKSFSCSHACNYRW